MRRELADLLRRLDDQNYRGVLVLGGQGIGKTVLLQRLEAELRRQGREVFLIRLSQVSDVDGLAASILREITPGVRRSSSAQQMLNRIAEGLQAPVLLLDGVDESRYPQRTAAAVEELSLGLDRWELVVTSRTVPGVEVRRFQRFAVLQLGSGPDADMMQLRSAKAPEDHLIGSAHRTSRDPAMPRVLPEEIARASGRDRISAPGGTLWLPGDRVHGLLGDRSVSDLLAINQAFVPASLREFVLLPGVFEWPFRLAELEFGAEEAERDDLLDASFVGRHNLDRILEQQRSIVIGDRGSGKSAIFRKLIEEQTIETSQ